MIRRVLAGVFGFGILGCGSNPAPVTPSVPTEPTAIVPAPPAVAPAPPTVAPASAAISKQEEAAIEKYVSALGGLAIRDVSHNNKGAPILTIRFDNADGSKVKLELKKFAPLPKLIRFTLEESKNADAILQQIGELTRLQDVSLAGSDLTDAGLAAVAGLPELRSLGLSRVQRITPAGWKALAAAPKLEELVLESSAIGDAGFKELAGLKMLRDLKLKGTNLTLAGTGPIFGGWKQLRTLDASDTKLDDAGLAATAQAKGLTSLKLHSVAITDDGLKGLAMLVKLQTLSLEGCEKITGTGFVHLGDLRLLETLSLADSPIGDAGLKEIAWLRNVKVLDLDRTKISDEGLRVLATPRGLEELSLQETQAGNAGVLGVAKAVKSLKTVSVRKSQVTKAIRAELAQQAPHATASFE